MSLMQTVTPMLVAVSSTNVRGKSSPLSFPNICNPPSVQRACVPSYVYFLSTHAPHTTMHLRKSTACPTKTTTSVSP